jgi:hypothetical protein
MKSDKIRNETVPKTLSVHFINGRIRNYKEKLLNHSCRFGIPKRRCRFKAYMPGFAGTPFKRW